MKADIRTDLAMEARELHAAGTGVSEQNEQREGYAISRIRIETDETAKAGYGMTAPPGTPSTWQKRSARRKGYTLR